MPDDDATRPPARTRPLDRPPAPDPRTAGWRRPGLRLPTLCAVCASWTLAPGICDGCRAYHLTAARRCVRCARPLTAPPDGAGRADALCPECTRWPPAFEAAFAAVDYDFPWDSLMRRFKYAAEVGLAEGLASMMARTLPDTGAHRWNLVLPVPLTAARLRERGYNQAWELARRLGGRLRVPSRSSVLWRRRETPPQAAGGRAERLANMRSMFAVAPRERTFVAGRRLLLVDDVLTTGATLDAAAQALRSAGAAHVDVCVFARTPDPMRPGGR